MNFCRQQSCPVLQGDYYPAPGRGTGYCFRAISFFVSLSATLRENGWAYLHEIFRDGVDCGVTMGRPDKILGQFG